MQYKQDGHNNQACDSMCVLNFIPSQTNTAEADVEDHANSHKEIFFCRQLGLRKVGVPHGFFEPCCLRSRGWERAKVILIIMNTL